MEIGKVYVQEYVNSCDSTFVKVLAKNKVGTYKVLAVDVCGKRTNKARTVNIHYHPPHWTLATESKIPNVLKGD